MRLLSFSSFHFSVSRKVKIGLLGLFFFVAIGMLALSYEVYQVELRMKRAAVELNTGRPRVATEMLDVLDKRPSFVLFARFGVMDREAFMRLRCAATVADREYEKAVDICSSALKVATSDRAKNEILFNRATAYIPLAVSGITPKGLSRATEDLKSVLRTEQHSRAALLLEKINLIKGGEGKGEAQSGDQKGRPGVQMFDEAPSSGSGGTTNGY